MKKIFISLIFMMVAISSYSQVSYGSYITLKQSNVLNRDNLDAVAFGKVDDQDLVVLRYIDGRAYKIFDQSSQILLKIGEDIIHLPMSKVDTEVTKDYKTSFVGNVHYNFYITYTSFDIEPEIVNRIVKNKELIGKVRIIFANGEIEDFEIKPKYQAKLSEGLINSYNSVANQDSERKGNMENDEAGF